MVGAIRSEKSKVSKFFDRKVRFQQGTDEVSTTATPVKQLPPALIPGAETHRKQKRKGASATRRLHGGLSSAAPPSEDMNTFFDQTSAPYPKTPVRRKRTVKRHIPLPTDTLADKLTGSSLFSPFSGKAIGMPDISDFADPDLSFLTPPRNSSRPPLSDLEMASLFPDFDSRDELERENKELRRKYNSLYEKHQKLVALVKKMSASLAADGIQVPGDVMMWDADDEFESSQSSMSSTFFSGSFPFSPAPSLTSSFSSMPSPVVAEAGTPAKSPALPVRIIDEDYDEGWDASAARRKQIRAEVSRRLGLTPDMSVEQTMDRLTDALDARVKIDDNYANDDSSNNNFDIVFPSLVLPSMPRFEI